MTPNYRIVTLCPNGISDQFRDYLNQSIDRTSGGQIDNRGLIALDLLKPFSSSDLPFCGVICAWSPSDISNAWIGRMINALSDLTCLNNDERVSVEEFSFQHDGYCFSIAGFYPLLDIEDESKRGYQYKVVSFLLNNNEIKKIHQKIIHFQHRV